MAKIIPGQAQLGGFLMHLLVEQLREQKVPWSMLPEADQQARIDHLGGKLNTAVRDGLRRVLGSGAPAIIVKLAKVDITEDGVKGHLVFTPAELHALTDFVGKEVVLVLMDPSVHTESTAQIRADADQPGLPLEDEDDDAHG
jgi:hypothetical protein